jgi:hypothetical protein
VNNPWTCGGCIIVVHFKFKLKRKFKFNVVQAQDAKTIILNLKLRTAQSTEISGYPDKMLDNRDSVALRGKAVPCRATIKRASQNGTHDNDGVRTQSATSSGGGIQVLDRNLKIYPETSCPGSSAAGADALQVPHRCSLSRQKVCFERMAAKFALKVLQPSFQPFLHGLVVAVWYACSLMRACMPLLPH